MTLLLDGLEAKVGGSLSSMKPSASDVREWNVLVDEGQDSSFDYRVLVGISVTLRKPAYGEVMAYHDKVAEQLKRGAPWVRETTRVAGDVQLAIEEGVQLPAALREVPWRLVSSAIDNVRDGRAYDDWPKSEKPKEGEKEIAKRVRQLVSALKKMEDNEEQGRALRHSVDAMLKLAKKLGHAVPRCQLPGIEEPTTRTVAEVPDVTADPVADEPDEPDEAPGRRRPRGGRRGGGRRGGSSGVRGENDQ